MTIILKPTLADEDFNSPPNSPISMLQRWLDSAKKMDVFEPNGMFLATVDRDCRPSSRMVLLKECDESGVIFGTSSESRKGKELETNPWASGTLWWHETIQQINLRGRVTKLSNEKSNELFYARTLEAQAVAAISHQSAPFDNEEEFRKQVSTLLKSKNKINPPETWHAYHLFIESIEFFHFSSDRIHKRLCYVLENGSWRYEFLQP